MASTGDSSPARTRLQKGPEHQKLCDNVVGLFELLVGPLVPMATRPRARGPVLLPLQGWVALTAAP